MTTKRRLVSYLDRHPQWFRKAEIIEIAVRAGQNGDTVARELRRAEEGLIKKSEYKQKNGETAIKYASLIVEPDKPETQKYILGDGRIIEI